MARPIREAPSPSAVPPALLRYLAERRVETSLVAETGGLGPAAIDLDEVPITSTALATMLVGASEALADPHLALGLPRALRYRRYDALTLAARASESPRAILDLVVRYAPLVFPTLVAKTSNYGDGAVCFGLSLSDQPRGLGAVVDEYLLAATLALAFRGEARRPARVWLAAPRPRHLEPLFDAFGTEDIDFGAKDTGFVLARAEAETPLADGGDPMLAATAEQLAGAALRAVPRRGAFATTVEAAIERTLGDSRAPSADDIAAALHMSTRTLQRRLDDESTRFSTVLDAVRESRARNLLLDPSIPLLEIAYRTGFSDLATFSRAFKRWSGTPPGAFRARAR